MPVWVRLIKNANKGETQVQVDDDLADSWPIGGQIVVTSSDYDRSQAETFIITNGTFCYLKKKISSVFESLLCFFGLFLS